ncbi:MAG: PIN domain-containing protein [Acidobacteria bacterium]|nr:PIN domain-containing protein [Acidobacteriota bacterium]
MKRYFLDTNFLVALELSTDQHHTIAVKKWNEVTSSPFHFVTTSYVFDETITFLNSRNHHEKAVEAGENLLLSPHVTFVHVNEDMFFKGWKLFQTYNDKRFSLTDCISFLAMRERGLSIALSFDADFTQAGFLVEPS